MTREEFEQGYAERSGVTVAWLRANGREARPCDCGDESCEGWQMAYLFDYCDEHQTDEWRCHAEGKHA